MNRLKEIRQTLPAHLEVYNFNISRDLPNFENDWVGCCNFCREGAMQKTESELFVFLDTHKTCSVAKKRVRKSRKPARKPKAVPVIEAPVVEAPAVEPTVAVELELSEEQLRQMRVLGFETVEAFLEHMAAHPIVPNPEKPKTRKRKAASEPRKRSITEKPRKVRTRKSKQVVENFHGYTTKKLGELVEQPYTDTGLEVCQEAAWEEYCLRLDAMSDDMIAEYLEDPKAHVAENPADWAGIIGFEGQSEEEAAPVIIVSEPVKAEAPAPVLMLPAPAPRLLLVQLPPPVRPDMIRKPMPPAPPADFEWILPPAPKAPVRAGLFSRVWSALKKIA